MAGTLPLAVLLYGHLWLDIVWVFLLTAYVKFKKEMLLTLFRDRLWLLLGIC